jgi:hypothetical protein
MAARHVDDEQGRQREKGWPTAERGPRLGGPCSAQEIAAMWRALFIAIGVTACILGVECMMIDKAILVDRGGTAPAVDAYGAAATAPAGKRELVPPDWAPWSLLSAGAVVMLYSFTLPKKWAG